MLCSRDWTRSAACWAEPSNGGQCLPRADNPPADQSDSSVMPHRSSASTFRHGPYLLAYCGLLAGSVLILILSALIGLCLISFFMMFSGAALTYYWLWSFGLAVPIWLLGSYWLFVRLVRALPVRQSPATPATQSDGDAPRPPRPWIDASRL